MGINKNRLYFYTVNNQLIKKFTIFGTVIEAYSTNIKLFTYENK